MEDIAMSRADIFSDAFKHRPAVARGTAWVLALCLWFPTFSGRSLSAQSSNAQALAGEGQELARKGDLEGSLIKYRDALEADPELDSVRFLLAHSLIRAGRFQEARPEFAALVLTDPQNGAARRGEITSLILMERYPEARRKLEEGLTVLPRDGQLAHTLARLLATAPDDAVRDGALALRLAEAVFRIKKTPQTSETMAMAAAETGNFELAIEMQNTLITEAEQKGARAEEIESLRQRLNFYQAAHPWRAESAMEIAMATEPPHAGPTG